MEVYKTWVVILTPFPVNQTHSLKLFSIPGADLGYCATQVEGSACVDRNGHVAAHRHRSHCTFLHICGGAAPRKLLVFSINMFSTDGGLTNIAEAL